MKNYCIISNQDKDIGLKVADYVTSLIREKGGEVALLSTNEEAKKKGENFTDLTGIKDNTQCIIIIGGDGTMIQAARELAKFDIPLIGIDLGTMGYLTDIEPDSIDEAIERLFNDDFYIEKRIIVKGSVIKGGNESYTGFALNDIVLGRSGFSRIVTATVSVGGELLNTYRGDGIIISTPTGSTAYNLSADGPILMPNANALAITPICPHSLDRRSVVVNASDIIEVTVMESKKSQEEEVIVSFDGNKGILITTGDSVRVQKAEFTTNLIKFNKGGFLTNLREKILN